MGCIISKSGVSSPANLDSPLEPQAPGHTASAPKPLPVGRRSPIQSELRSKLSQAPHSSQPPLLKPPVKLTPALQEKLKSPQETVPKTHEAGGSAKAAPHASDVKPVVVLDWDDCLRYEKGMNYQLVHNALVIAARMHAQDLPKLGEAVDRLHDRMHDLKQRGEQPKDGDPLIMKSQEDCENYLAANSGIYKRGLVQDFVRTMLPDIDSSMAEAITDAAYTQCALEYNRLMAAPDQKEGWRQDLPFPDVRIALMPGARELLDTSRAEGSPVLLISNRAHSDLQKEVRYLGMQQDFDVVSGAPTITDKKSKTTPSPMPQTLEQQLIAALKGDDDGALRTALEAASPYAHPNTTSVKQTDHKPRDTRLLNGLERLSVPSDAPIVLYGDQESDISQAATLAAAGRHVEGVLIDPGRDDVGQQIGIQGIPTRVIGSLTDADAPWKTAAASRASLPSVLAPIPQALRPGSAGPVQDGHLFSVTRSVPFILSRPGQAAPSLPVAAGGGVVYSRDKQALGGSDVGMVAWMDGNEHLVKTGLPRSLLGQIVSCWATGQEADGDKRVGYLIGIWARLSGNDENKDVLETQLKTALRTFIQSENGSALFEKSKSEALDLADVSAIHRALTEACPELKNPLGMPALFELVNGAASQALANALQRTYLPEDQMPDATLLVSHDNVLLASRLLPDAVPMDDFLTRSFLPQGVSLQDAKLAAARIKANPEGDSAELRSARELIARLCDPQQLEAGRAGLTQALAAQGMDGFFASVLARLTIGENHKDLGPDNMLLVRGADGRNKAVNIDVTGFWEPRHGGAPTGENEQPQLGWSEVIAHPERAADILLDPTVLSGRYARGFEAVHDVVVDVLRNTLREQATPEATSVRAWYAAQDEGQLLASMSELQHALRDVAQLGWMCDAETLEKGFGRHASFIRDVVGQAKEAQHAA
ncbi:type III effector protein [Ralstonia solanacearum]|uniref:type III effector protein n=1 Tax=Ralstonia solanacearum TaxID=305 RepID=UPI0005040128|nr:type III effector protein [Ralstonia solanacearum]KFX29328.1 type III effector protein [Ralstonia solanacearum]